MPERMDRREFLKSLSSAVLGGVIGFGLLGRTSALGQVPLEERMDSLALEEGVEGIVLSPMIKLGTGIRQEYARIAVTEDGRIWTVYVSEKKAGEGIYLREIIKDGSLGDEIKISSSSGHEFMPRIMVQGNILHVVWAARREGKSLVIYSQVVNGSPGPETVLSSDIGINWKPVLAVLPGGALWTAWEHKSGKSWQVAIHKLDAVGPMDVARIGEEGQDNCRPALCADASGAVWAAWDRNIGDGNTEIFLKQISDVGSKEIRITAHPATDIAPSIAADREGAIWITWHSNRKGDNGWDIPRWFQLRAWKDGMLHEPATPPLDMDLEKDGEDQGFEFPQVICGIDGRVIITGRPSHNFCIQWYKGDEWSRLHRLPKDGWGGRGQYLSAAFAPGGLLWLARRDLAANIAQSLGGLQGEYLKPVLKPVINPLKVPELAGVERRIKRPEWNGFQFYFGDIHSHSWMSDGMGDLDEFYVVHRDFLKDDFGSLTDHDTFVDNGLLPSEWEQQKAVCEHYNDPGRFVTLFGQEWTTARWPKKYGHKNIYHIDPSVPLMDHTTEKYDTAAKLFAKMKEIGAICIPHHIAWTGVDWENHDPEVQPLVEIVSNHGAFEYMGNKPIYHRGGIKGCFMQDGLARDLRFGVVGGSDTHGLIWHHRVGWKRNCLRTGMTCILAKELTREALFDAMKKRRVYATSGVKMRLVFEVSGAMMGEEISVETYPEIRMEVESPLDVRWIEIVRNNETVYCYGGEGYRTRFTWRESEITGGKYYYYARIITEDGNMGWTSPVWVTYNPA